MRQGEGTGLPGPELIPETIVTVKHSSVLIESDCSFSTFLSDYPSQNFNLLKKQFRKLGRSASNINDANICKQKKIPASPAVWCSSKSLNPELLSCTINTIGL